MRGSFYEGEIDGGTEVGRQLPALHGDGLLKLQGCAHELSHLAAIIPQLTVELAVGQVKVFQAGKFNLEFLDLFEGEMREGAPMRGHGTVQNLTGQAVAQLAARDHAFRVAAGMGKPCDKGSVLFRSGTTISGSWPVGMIRRF